MYTSSDCDFDDLTVLVTKPTLQLFGLGELAQDTSVGYKADCADALGIADSTDGLSGLENSFCAVFGCLHGIREVLFEQFYVVLEDFVRGTLALAHEHLDLSLVLPVEQLSLPSPLSATQ